MSKEKLFPGLFTIVLLTLLGAACSPTPAEDVEARLAAIEANMSTGDQHGASDEAFAVAVGQYVMDSAEFHEIDEALADGSPIEPDYLVTTRRVLRVTGATPWPAALEPEAAALTSLLTAFAVALEADDAEEAAELAGQVHDAQHDFSSNINDWLGSASVEHEHEEGANHDQDGDSGHEHEAEGTDHDADEEMAGDDHEDGAHEHGSEMVAAEEEIAIILTVEADPEGGYNLSVETTNFTLSPENASGEHVPGEGHIHLYVDGESFGTYFTRTFFLEQLDPGVHEIRVSLNSNDHRGYMFAGEAVEAVLDLTVDEY